MNDPINFKFPPEWAKQQQLGNPNVLKQRKLKFGEMLHTDKVRCVGYISKTGIPVLYGEHYRNIFNLCP